MGYDCSRIEGRQAGRQAGRLLEDIVSNGSIDGHMSNELYYALLS